eukprot:TRINITY_DN7615_c0_g1_i1.p1 TRINITY_DN7615_c0_g1~~TRINITY_DN7615_c0_g1_i1.p1  ORF type:complete len:674 (+),score=174.83 TRINITY_DN7615_c0_g1_i1:130-2022(+)
MAALNACKPEPDLAQWQSTLHAMQQAELLPAQVHSLIRLLYGCMALSGLELATIEDANDEDILTAAASLMQLPLGQLATFINHRTFRIAQDVFVKPRLDEDRRVAVNSVIKQTYTVLFHWLVEQLNQALGGGTHTDRHRHRSSKAIGLLDIFGFESLNVNSLEQLCINLTNERLQSHYIQHLVKAQSALLLEEGLIRKDQSIFVEDQSCLDLLTGKAGLFALLNEDSRLRRRRSQELESAFAARVATELKHPCFRACRGLEAAFEIRQYASKVVYNSSNMSFKNKDAPLEGLADLLAQSRCLLLKEALDHAQLTTATPSVAKPKRKQDTITSKYLASLTALFERLEQGDPHYIRCISSNDKCQPNYFDNNAVARQLSASGVPHSLEVFAAGRPVHYDMAGFERQFGRVLMLPAASEPCELAPALRKLLCRHGKDGAHTRGCDVLFGRTKLFFRYQHLETLNAMAGQVKEQAVIRIQSAWRRRCAVLLAQQRLKAILTLQRWSRRAIAKRQVQKQCASIRAFVNMLACKLTHRSAMDQQRQAFSIAAVSPVDFESINAANSPARTASEVFPVLEKPETPAMIASKTSSLKPSAADKPFQPCKRRTRRACLLRNANELPHAMREKHAWSSGY